MLLGRDLEARVKALESVAAHIEEILPGLRHLIDLRVNLDRLGPRLAILDELRPRLAILDELGPRLAILDELGPLISPLRTLAAQVEILGRINDVLRIYLDGNHEVAESVRVDVETISALALQTQMLNRQLVERLEQLLSK